MTSKLTRLTDDELTETLRLATSGYPLSASTEANLRHAFAELQERRKAAMDSEPVAEVVSMFGDPEAFGERELKLLVGIQSMPYGTKFYRHAQKPVDGEFIPKNLDKALGVVGVALPESKEEFNFQIERWIQRLIDRVIRYADEFKEQPAPVVPENRAITQHFDTIALETAREILCDVNRRHEFLGGEVQLLSRIQCRIDAACRAAMLQAGNSPAHSVLRPEQISGSPAQDGNSPAQSPIDHGYRPECECSGCKATARICAELAGNSPVIPDGYVMVPKEPTDEMIAAAMNCDDVLFNSDESFCVQFGNIYKAMLAAAPQPQNEPQNIPEIIPQWIPVSERMPERGDYLVTDGRDFDVQSFDGEQFIPGFVWEDGITHWMPLPAVPQEVSHG